MEKKIKPFDLITVDAHRIATTIDIYFVWKDLDARLRTLSTRGINFPSEISENIVCYCLDYQLNKGSSGDAFDPRTKQIIEIKGSSSSGPSSFSPSEQFDQLIFVKLDKSNDTIDIYITNVNSEILKTIAVNGTQTVYDQQQSGRRPRFNIEDMIIKPQRIDPCIRFNLRSREITQL